MDTSKPIDDAGEYVPHARKHLARKEGKLTQDAISLKELWPEPDWCAERDAGRPVEVLAHLAMVYDGLGKSPRTECYGVSAKEWRDTYQDCIELLKQLFSETNTVEQAKLINNRLGAMLGLNLKNIPKLPDYEAAVFWSAGRGKRRLYAPGNMTPRQQVFAKWLPKLGWPDADGALKCALYPVKLKDGTWHVGRIEGNSVTLEREATGMSCEAEAIAAVLKLVAFETGKNVVVRSQKVDKQKRAGVDWRNGKDATAELLMAEFGLRAIQYGNSISQVQRQHWLNAAFDALADLADILGMKRRWIGLGGLALAFGARGKGKALAHYEPDLRTVNITRNKGAGSMAHEWAHGLDHRLVQTLGITYSYSRFATSCIQSVWKSLRTERQRAIAEPLRLIREYSWYMNEDSAFLRQSMKLSSRRGGGSYWHEPEEMFARGFEAYVQDALAKQGRHSPWLVYGTLEEDFPPENDTPCPYPTGEERQILCAHYQKLMELLSSK